MKENKLFHLLMKFWKINTITLLPTIDLHWRISKKKILHMKEIVHRLLSLSRVDKAISTISRLFFIVMLDLVRILLWSVIINSILTARHSRDFKLSVMSNDKQEISHLRITISKKLEISHFYLKLMNFYLQSQDHKTIPQWLLSSYHLFRHNNRKYPLYNQSFWTENWLNWKVMKV